MTNQHKSYNIDDVRAMFRSEGYKLKTSFYKNVRQRLYFTCPCGHDYFIMLGSWNNGRRCAICAGRRVDVREVKKIIEDRGCTMLSQYTGSGKKIKMVCPKGHEFDMTWDNFKQGHGCYRCRGQTSRAENVLLEMLRNKYKDFNILQKNRKIIPPYEVDIAIPEYDIAIEYNGAGHHMPIYGSSPERRIENLLDIKERDRIKKEMLHNKNWLFLYINDFGPFNSELISKAFCWISSKIDRRVQQIRVRNVLHIDDIS